MTCTQNLKSRGCLGNVGKVGCKDMSSVQLAHDKSPMSGVVVMAVNPGVT
jgi:hypothetical protein